MYRLYFTPPQLKVKDSYFEIILFSLKSKMCSVIGFLTPFKNILHFSQPPSPLFRICAILQDVTPTKQTSRKSNAYFRLAACFG